jgi:hypothetical protein
MTDILSGGEESDANHDRFSDDNNNLTHASGSSGGQGSNANTLFGMNIKKTLSRPADRVEQVTCGTHVTVIAVMYGTQACLL